ncbi:MAG TPA: hypothetical protein VLI68_14205 [Hanamia sp.]|nr:hypothetical protein [Hanamia sp.]
MAQKKENTKIKSNWQTTFIDKKSESAIFLSLLNTYYTSIPNYFYSGI